MIPPGGPGQRPTVSAKGERAGRPARSPAGNRKMLLCNTDGIALGEYGGD
ncbi:hypothetical protein ACLIYP_01175 [Streptomyces nanhaiensis]